MGLLEAPSTAVCNNVDIVARILSHVPWHTLSAFSRANRSSRLSSQERVKSLVTRALDPYVTCGEIQSFTALLRDRRALVVGSVTRRVFCFNQGWYESIPGQLYNEHDRSSDLNIIVPGMEFQSAIQDMEKMGFSSFLDTAVFPHLRLHVLEVVTGTKVVRLASGDEIRLNVTISRAAKAPLAALLASCWTGQINAIADGRVYCFYPGLTLANLSLRSDIKVEDYTTRHHSVIMEYDNDDFKVPCGPCCPALNRKTFGDEGVAIAAWRRDGVHFWDSDSDELLNERCFLWRFTEFCHNPTCEFWSPPTSRI
ncbi:hypothetical protein BKA70DRAFT_1447932 [Coprinopsis sp. MPI-PUGE-AT-0042]|nr:hypothetical protein BKA70DRAFT_1447932 [Coprinopsis sp. MPI-PUGE-AT-0042]